MVTGRRPAFVSACQFVWVRGSAFGCVGVAVATVFSVLMEGSFKVGLAVILCDAEAPLAERPYGNGYVRA